MRAEIRYERIINAPPEEVFDALTSPVGQLTFYGQDDPGWIVQSESDLRVGGAWTIHFGPSPEQLYRHHHLFIAIKRPRHLLLSTTETRLDGTTLRYETEFTFKALGDGTLMTMIQRGLPTEQLRTEHARGVPNAFDRLQRYLHDPATRLS